MISFARQGEFGRLGNQLFQYAYVRSQAKRLGTKFYCPLWIGDGIFDLKDEGEKTPAFKAQYQYVESAFRHGFSVEAASIKDDTDVAGFFQSERFFSKEDVTKWFSFKEEMFAQVNKKYQHIDFSNSTAIHIRLGDYIHPNLQFYSPKVSYFKKALALMDQKKHVLVFSDQPDLARRYLKSIKDNLVFIEGNEDHEDFYLMTKCRNMICSSSSFSWWAAYLNTHADKKIVMPSQWFLPGSRTTNNDIFVDEWIKLPAHRFYDNYYLRAVPFKLRQYCRKLLARRKDVRA